MELLLGQKIKLSFGSARTKAWDGEMANNVMRAQNARRQGDRKGAGGRAGGRTMLLGKVLNTRALSPPSVRRAVQSSVALRSEWKTDAVEGGDPPFCAHRFSD